jgi:hypothetical protein
MDYFPFPSFPPSRRVGLLTPGTAGGKIFLPSKIIKETISKPPCYKSSCFLDGSSFIGFVDKNAA